MKKHNHNDFNISSKTETNNIENIEFTENNIQPDIDHNNTVFTLKNLISRKKIVGSYKVLNETGFKTVFENKENNVETGVKAIDLRKDYESELREDYESELREEESIYQKYINGITYNMTYYLYFTTKRNRNVFGATNKDDIIKQLKKRINMRYRYIKDIEISDNSIQIEIAQPSFRSGYETFVNVKEHITKILNKDYEFFSGYSSYFTKNYLVWSKPIPRMVRTDFDDYTYRRTRTYLNHDLPPGLLLDNLNYEVAFFTRRNRNLFKGDIKKDLYDCIMNLEKEGFEKIEFCSIAANYIHISFKIKPTLSPHKFIIFLKKELHKLMSSKYPSVIGNVALFTRVYLISSIPILTMVLENYGIFHKLNFTTKYEDL